MNRDHNLRAVEAHEDEKGRAGIELDKLTLQNEAAIKYDPDQIGQYLDDEFCNDLNICRVMCKNDAARFMAMYDELLDERIKKAAEKMARHEIDHRIPCITEDTVRAIYTGCGWRP